MHLVIVIGMLSSILRYIKNAPGHALLYEERGNSKIVCYSDADWARSPLDRRSTFGYCVLVGGTWFHGEARSKIQLLNLVSKLNIVPWQQLHAKSHDLSNFSISYNLKTLETTSLYAIVKPLFTVQYNPVFHEQTKHKKIDSHFVRE